MNLLTDPVFRVQTTGGLMTMSLPGLLASLGKDEVEHLPGIQRHQEDPFHVFLCCLAGAILAREGDTDTTQEEAYWRDTLRMLAGPAGDDAWTLVVDDPALPAFMQSPVPGGKAGKSTSMAWTPDELDVLQTAKNHDVKASRAHHAHPDEWVYALVSLQTMSGFLGQGNYGIARMNSGFGNRPIVELIRSTRPGARWRDAVTRLLEHREQVLSEPFGFSDQGLVLVWLEPWDGTTSLKLSQLDPFFIEICRRVRLLWVDGSIVAQRFGTKTRRIAAENLRGVVGDAWLPVDQRNGDTTRPSDVRALTVSARGLTPDLLRGLIFGDDFSHSRLHKPMPHWDGRVWLHASVLVRGQGTTDGFHSRLIPIPREVQSRLFHAQPHRDPLASLSKDAISYAGRMQRSVLRPAIFSFLAGGPETIQFDREAAQGWWTRYALRFEALWSRDYFPWLWGVPESFDEEAVLTRWSETLRNHALTVLGEAEEALPQRHGRRYRARIRADREFRRALLREFPQLRKEGGDERVSST